MHVHTHTHNTHTHTQPSAPFFLFCTLPLACRFAVRPCLKKHIAPGTCNARNGLYLRPMLARPLPTRTSFSAIPARQEQHWRTLRRTAPHHWCVIVTAVVAPGRGFAARQTCAAVRMLLLTRRSNTCAKPQLVAQARFVGGAAKKSVEKQLLL